MGPVVRCAVLGDPIAHSLSPTLHRAGYDAAGLTGWSYEAIRTTGSDLPRLLADLAPPWRGLSLTMPLKRDVLEVLDVLEGGSGRDGVSDRARRVGAANTVLVTDEGLRADNTDLPGAAAALRERWEGPVATATLLGAGATAASTGLALCDLGARRVVLLARSPERAGATADVLRRHPVGPEVEVRSLDDLDALSPDQAEVVVSTVPAAAQTTDLVAAAARRPVVFEVRYDPWPTPLARAAATSGATLVGGLDLLVHQAALQFTAFTGLPAPLAAMRTAGERELARRAAPDS